jgi:hypothetical protein
MGQRTSSFLGRNLLGRKGACDGIKEVKDPMQDISLCQLQTRE